MYACHYINMYVCMYVLILCTQTLKVQQHSYDNESMCFFKLAILASCKQLMRTQSDPHYKYVLPWLQIIEQTVPVSHDAMVALFLGVYSLAIATISNTRLM